jgi:hypothetical protein
MSLVAMVPKKKPAIVAGRTVSDKNSNAASP